MPRLTVSEAAAADIRAHYRQGIELFGVRQADDYATGLRETIRRLADFPRSGVERRDFRQNVRIASYRSHVIVYTLTTEAVHILRVRHAAEDWAADPIGEHR